jgi:cell division protein ZapA
MSGEANFLDVRILGREYRVACPSEEQEALLAAVKLVDDRMREITDKAKNMTLERAAVMAALNIAHEYLNIAEKHQTGFDSARLRRRIKVMDTQLDTLLAQQELSL